MQSEALSFNLNKETIGDYILSWKGLSSIIYCSIECIYKYHISLQIVEAYLSTARFATNVKSSCLSKQKHTHLSRGTNGQFAILFSNITLTYLLYFNFFPCWCWHKPDWQAIKLSVVVANTCTNSQLFILATMEYFCVLFSVQGSCKSRFEFMVLARLILFKKVPSVEGTFG